MTRDTKFYTILSATSNKNRIQKTNDSQKLRHKCLAILLIKANIG